MALVRNGRNWRRAAAPQYLACCGHRSGESDVDRRLPALHARWRDPSRSRSGSWYFPCGNLQAANSHRALRARHLTGAELDLAIAHEVAHREAFDNLARWSMLCAPDFLAKSEVGSRLERGWHVAAESLADATATRGDETRAVQLASALVKVARLAAVTGQRAPALSWSTLNDSELLERRVERLLTGGAHTLPPSRLRVLGAAALTALCMALPVFIPAVHHLTESLVALLP